MTVFDLFSGIGGFSLGLERAGFTTQYFCEIDPYCRGVLAKHWPHVPCFEDVRTVRGVDLTPVDLLCGGFPCQDISLAGKGAGLSGERSGLWFEYARLIDEIRPRYVLIENVSALRSRGLDHVLGSLAALGYDAEWHCIPACAVGAPHRRDRVWIVAYAERPGSQGLRAEHGLRENQKEMQVGRGGWWASEPAIQRVADGLPGRIHRLKSLGNAIVPQIAELLGYAILAHAESVRLTEVPA